MPSEKPVHIPHIAASSGFRMRKTNWKTVSTLVTMALLAGCQERSATAPESASVGPAPLMLAPEGRPQLSLNGNNGDNQAVDFVVGPKGGTFLTGNHAVVIPANGICDPATSSYGPGTWDAPCKPLTRSLTVHAVTRTEAGRTWVDFAPSLRFVPSQSTSNWAWIYLYTPSAKGKTSGQLAAFNILYAAKIGGPTTDESVLDATLRTYVDTNAGVSVRRIKHFSGYTSSAGRACDPALTTDCFPAPE